MKESPVLAIIGGSGLYKMPDLEDTQEVELETPFGKTSAPIITGRLAGQTVAFLARHGVGHYIMPSQVPYQANIYALKSLGVERIVSISACGSLREDYVPGDIVVPNQLFDFTRNRRRTFFGDGLVAHISVADPFCPDLSAQVAASVEKVGGRTHRSGIFITIEGPRFSTKAESNNFRSWGMSIIGMTTSPEAFLAREAEICYAVMAHVTDYDVWHVSQKPVTVGQVVEVLNRNTELAQEAVRRLVRDYLSQEPLPERQCECAQALSTALITDPEAIPSETRQKLDLLVGKYL
jgi:5'-methylthioadenosine phosphorylase